jgi:gliding motility-associated protein GldM
MAGGKETPRQKMIGLVYLALTALLAMNITTTVLDKFISINKSLEKAIADEVSRNDMTVAAISAAVSESGSREADVAILEKARRVRNETQTVLRGLQEYKTAFVEITGGLDEKGEPIGKTNVDKVPNYMINQGKGAELKKLLDDYVQFVRTETGLANRIAGIALDGSEDPRFMNDSEQRMKDFASLRFENTPTVAGIAEISQLASEVLNRESIALDDLKTKVGAADLRFDNILPMVRAEAKYVAAGTKYEADLFLSASLSSVEPEMFINGNAIPVENGIGRIEFNASGGGYNADGVARRTYSTEIKLPRPGGGDTTFIAEMEYFVVQPVVQIQSAAISQLYLNAGNELNIQVPALGAAYDPQISANGAQVIAGPDKGLVTVVPNAAEVTLNIASAGTLLETRNFPVRRIPLPTVTPAVGNRPANQVQGEPSGQLRELTMRVEADENFRQFLPADARYRVVSFKITLARGVRAVQQINIQGGTANLGNLMAQAQAGDRLIIEEVVVQRRNFQDQNEAVNLPNTPFTIPLR